MSGIVIAQALLSLAAGDDGAQVAPIFAPPVMLKAAGAPIEGEIGHLAPYVHDWDGDGLRDLLVGQFGGGHLAIYRNRGTQTQPVYEAARWFEVGGERASVPAG